MTRLLLSLALAVALAMAAACDDDEPDTGARVEEADGEETETETTEPDVEPTETPSETETPTAEPTPEEFVLGDTVETEEGNTITVFSYEAPVESGNEFITPQQESNVFARIDVEACAAPNAPGGSWDINEFDFQLAFTDNTRVDPGFAGFEPALTLTTLLPGDCLRGFIGFEISPAAVAEYVFYSGFTADFDDVIIRWRIQ